MKKKKIVILTLLILLVIYVVSRIRSAMPGPEKGDSLAEPSSPDKDPIAAIKDAPRETELSPVKNGENLRGLLENADTTNQAGLMKLVEKLKTMDPARVASFFQNEMERLRSGPVEERARLVRVADTLQSPELLSFWTSLAFRQSPLYDNEEALMAEKVAADPQAAVQQEMLFAMKNIAILAPSSPEAIGTLETIATAASPSKAKDPFSREQAFGLLQELDPAAALRAYNALDADDPLRPVLKERFPNP